MKKAFWRRAACAALLIPALTLTGCGQGPAVSATTAPRAAAEPADVTPDGAAAVLFAVNVGKGDALLLRVGGWTGLIDAGKACARGRVLSAMARLGVAALDAVFLTHTDADHAGGLDWLARSDVPVGAWYASAMFSGAKREKHPAVKAAARRGAEVRWLKRGDEVPLGDTGAVLKVLAPASLHEDEDDNSLVMLLACADGRMLLTGDLELPGEAALLAFGDDLACDVLKVSNHGDADATTEAFARAAGARIAVISTDAAEKPGTPDAGVVRRLEAAGAEVWVTQDAGLGVRIALAGGEASAEAVDFGAPAAAGLRIEAVDADDDRVALRNDSGADVDLGGFYLYSERGGELFAFPAGTAIAAGGGLVVGTRSTGGDYDVLWDDAKVVHGKKADAVCLYDAFGRLVDRRGNGK